MLGWILLLVILVIIIDVFVSKKFEEIANMKGHSVYFWWCFWLTSIGWAMVIALPDRNIKFPGVLFKSNRHLRSCRSRQPVLRSLRKVTDFRIFNEVFSHAGALLKDAKTNKVLVQLKIRNLYHSPLIACKVCIRAFETSGVELQGLGSHSYLDLNVSYGMDFGSQEAAYLPDGTTRRVSVSVIQAVFADQTIWQHPSEEWTQVPFRHQRISDRFSDPELQKQYFIEVGEDCEYVPEISGDLFLCTCGSINMSSEKRCPRCGRDAGSLLSALDIESLTQKRDERLLREEEERVRRRRIEEEHRRERARVAEEERRKRAEQERIAKAAKRKTRRNALIACTAIMFVIAVTAFVRLVVLPNNRYKTAETLFAQGDYDGAAAAFTELGDYKDSAERAREAAYEGASALENEGSLAEAAIAFGKLGEYLDAKEMSYSIWDRIADREVISCGYEQL